MTSSDRSQNRQQICRRPERLDSYGQNDSDSNNSLELSVFLMNETEIGLSFRAKTRGLTANHVLNEIWKRLYSYELNFDSKYKILFSIWVTSPYLELQCQPSHRPFTILGKWDSLLAKHGPRELLSDPTLIEKDSPTLSFQRNVFCDQLMEKEITALDIGALYLLYFEAKLNVLDGRYPDSDFEQLAAYQAIIDLEAPSNQNDYSIEYFRQNLKKYIPFNYNKTSDSNKFNGLIRTLSRSTPSIRCAQNIYKKYNEISKDKLSKYKLLKSYLEICWDIPSYGSAYFSAQIERPIKSKMDSLVNHFDLEIWVALNQRGLHVISKEKPELLLSIDYEDLCWAVGCPENSDPNCIPCIYIQIPEENNETNILQIFSRQYRLIESLLNSFIKEAKITFNSNDSKRNSNNSYDVVDGPIPAPTVIPPLHSEPGPQKLKTIKTERLSLAKFNSSGQVLNKPSSWVRSLKENKSFNNI